MASCFTRNKRVMAYKMLGYLAPAVCLTSCPSSSPTLPSALLFWSPQGICFLEQSCPDFCSLCLLTPSRLAQLFCVRPIPTTLFQSASPPPHSHLPSVCVCVCVKSLQLCPTLCDAVDCSPPGSSVHRILQARILEWVAISSSRGSF